jgi:hypothetical protein
MNTKLELVQLDGCDINANTGEITIKNIRLKFDSKVTDIEIDFLDALDLVVKALRSGQIKPTFIN